MVRSRSSFDNLDAAIASATSLRPAKKRADPTPVYKGVELVSFGGEAAPEPPPPPSHTPASARPDDEAALSSDGKKPPKLPDLVGVKSSVLRCEKILEWIVEATVSTDVFLADAAGLPLAGAFADAEARLAAAGLTAAAIAQLAVSIPGNTSALFELHIGEGPFFQLISFEAGARLYLLGLTRVAPLTPRQAHAIRLACQHALEEAPAPTGSQKVPGAPRTPSGS